MKFFFALLTMLTLASCNEDRPGSDLKILNGSTVGRDAARALGIVGLRAQMDDKISGYCTGILLDASHILTAAHCLATPRGPVRFAVLDAVIFPAAKESVYSIESYYRPNTQDIAILKLESPVPLTRFLKIQDSKANLSSKDEVFAYGFGRQNAQITQSGGSLNLKSMTIGHFDSSSPIITAFPKSDGGPCFGDSGGPLLIGNPRSQNFSILGVLSNGNSDCRGGDSWTNAVALRDSLTQALDDESAFESL